MKSSNSSYLNFVCPQPTPESMSIKSFKIYKKIPKDEMDVSGTQQIQFIESHK